MLFLCTYPNVRILKLLCVDELSIAFEHNSSGGFVLENLSMQLDRGKILSVVGESGSGKSLSALAVLGLLPPSAKIISGRIYWHQSLDLREAQADVRAGVRATESLNLLELNAEQWRKMRAHSMSMVFQEPMTALNPIMKCGRQIQERIQVMTSTQSLRTSSKHLHPERLDVRQLLSEVELTEIDRVINSYPHQLSGGQRQRLMIAMALVGEPHLLIADEPTTALDASVQASILELLSRLVRSRGLSMLLVSHDLGLVDRMADDVLVLRKGKTIEYGPTSHVLKQPKSTYTQALLASRLDPSKKGKKLSMLSENGVLSDPEPLMERNRCNEESGPMLHIKGLSVRYPLPGKPFGGIKYRQALESIDLHIQTGKTLGLLGESGSGKSTLSRVLVGLTPAVTGEIRLDGKPYEPHKIEAHTRARMVQMIFQDPYSSLNPSKKIGDTLAEVVRVHRLRPRGATKERVTELLESVGLDEGYAHRYPAQLSGGQRQRVVIARALAAEPRLLVCDESVSALDVSVRAQVLNLLKSLQESLNLTYLFISHDLSVVYYMSDEIAVLHHGRIVEHKKADDLYAHPEHPYTQQLLATANAMDNQST